MMFPKVFCLITLCTLTRAVADLDKFNEISRGVSQVTIQDEKSYDFYTNVEMDQIKEECAQRCLSMSSFCQSFTIFELSQYGFICRMFAEANWISYPSGSETEVQLFVKRQPEQVEDISARFSHNDEQPEKDWANEIQTRYGLVGRFPEQNQLDRDVLRVCNKAIHGDPPMSVMISRQLMDLTLNSWAQHSTNSDTFSEGFDTIVLTFLEIFSKNAKKDVTTFYDATKRMLFIQREDFYLLIISRPPGHYEILRYTKSGNIFIQSTIAARNLRIDNEQKNDALELFKNEVARHAPHATIPLNPNRGMLPRNADDEQSIATTVFITVADAIFRPETHFSSIQSTREEIFYRDIVTAVLSSVYAKIKAGLFHKNMFRSAQTAHFTDTTVRATGAKRKSTSAKRKFVPDDSGSFDRDLEAKQRKHM